MPTKRPDDRQTGRSIQVCGFEFLGATMWTNFALCRDPEAGMRLAGEKMNDYRKIRTGNYRLKLRPLDTLRRHQDARKLFGFPANVARSRPVRYRQAKHRRHIRGWE
jgi:hypothetical protein